MSRIPVWSLGLFLVSLLIAPASALAQPDACTVVVKEAPADTSVIVVVNDATRRDRAGAYGGSAATPNLDAFASEALLFERAVSQSPWSKPSIATLFTSLHPSVHGVASDPELRRALGGTTSDTIAADILSDEFTTLAEAFQAAGFRTGAIVGNPWLRSEYGFAQGFEHFDDSFAAFDASGDQVTEAGLAWLSGLEEGERFFLYLHYLDSHRPYGPVALEQALAVEPDDRVLDESGQYFFLRYITQPDGTPLMHPTLAPNAAVLELAYDHGVEEFDAHFGKLMAGLRAQPAWSRTAVVFASDHGEALYERGYGNHGGGLFDDELAVPLVARLPGATPGRNACDVGLVDVAPTLCGYAGVACPPDGQGRNLLDPAEAGSRLVVSEGVMKHAKHRAVRDGRFKLIYEPEGRRGREASESVYSLYDLEKDPGEKRDLLDAPDAEAQAAFERLRKALPEAAPTAGPGS